MSNRKRSSGKPLSAMRFMVRVHSDEPVKMEDHQVFTLFDPNLIHERARQMIARSSFMAPVNGPNREVYWSIEWWNPGRGTWETMQQGRSRLKPDVTPS